MNKKIQKHLNFLVSKHFVADDLLGIKSNFEAVQFAFD